MWTMGHLLNLLHQFIKVSKFVLTNGLCIFGMSSVPSHKSSRKNVASLHVFVSCLVFV